MDEAVPSLHTFSISASVPCKLVRWHVQLGDRVQKGRALCTYVQQADGGRMDEREQSLRSSVVGIVAELLQKEGTVVQPGTAVAKVEENCDHSVVVYDLCALCGRNLRKPPSTQGDSGTHPHSATVSMIHGIPELRISRKEAEVLGNRDKQRLLECRKLALVVDLDQTLIHTSMDPNIESGLQDVFTFTLPGYPALYHCRLRPYVHNFLKQVSQFYELHVFTMGTKSYAKCVTEILDPGKRLFCDRIISRDECFDPTSKVLQLKSVFPCGDSMVAIIDDREDVWGGCPNLVHVKPYVFFAGTADINATPSGHTTHGAHPVPLDPHHPLKRRFLSPGVTTPLRREQPVAAATSAKAFHPLHTTRGAEGTREAEGTKNISLNSNSNNNNGGGGAGEEDNGGGDSSSSSSSSSSESSDSDADSGDSSSSGVNDGLFEPPGGGAFEPPGGGVLSSSAGERGLPQLGGDVTSADKTLGECSAVPSGPVLSPGESKEEKVMAGDVEGVSIRREEEAGACLAGTVEVISAAERCIGDDVTGVAAGEVERLQPAACDLTELQSRKPLTVPSEQHSVPPLTQPGHQSVPPLTQPGHHTTTQPAKPHPREIKDSDDFLHYLGNTLERIHSTFYGEYQASEEAPPTVPDLKDIIPRLRHSVLKGAKVLFTGVIPTNTPPRRSPEWCTALAFGAVVHEELVPGLHSCDHRKAQRATTHIIVGRPGTSKLKEARKMLGIKVVSPAWLWACAERWQWADETMFPPHFEHHVKGVRGEEEKGPGPSKKEGRGLPKEEEGRGFPKEEEGQSELVHKSVNKVEETMKGKMGKRSRDSNGEEVQKVVQEEEEEGGKERHREVKRTEEEEKEEEEEGVAAEDWEGEEEDLSKPLHRQVARIDSYISVSDEELEKMEAEVDAEIGDSSSDSEEDDLGTVPREEVEVPQGEEDPLSGLYPDGANKGLDPSGGFEEDEEEDEEPYGRKRKRMDMESNSSTSAGKVEEESSIEEDDGSGMDDLALLLAGDD